MRGFVFVTLGLVALQVALSTDGVIRLGEGGGQLVGVIHGFLSPAVPGIRNRGAAAKAAAGASTVGGGISLPPTDQH